MLKFCLLAFVFIAACSIAKAQTCNETGPCQQLACEQVSGYCNACEHNTDCDPDGTSGMLECQQTTTWTDWYFGTTCSSESAYYCMYQPCDPFLAKENNRAKVVLARLRARRLQHVG